MHLCVLYTCVCTCGGVHIPMCVRREKGRWREGDGGEGVRARGRERELTEVDIQCFLSLSTLYLEIGSFTEPRVHCFV